MFSPLLGIQTRRLNQCSGGKLRVAEFATARRERRSKSCSSDSPCVSIHEKLKRLESPRRLPELSALAREYLPLPSKNEPPSGSELFLKRRRFLQKLTPT